METSNNPYSQWFDQWLTMQRSAMDNAMDMMANAWPPQETESGNAEGAGQMTRDWLEGMQQFWQGAQTPAMGDDGQALWGKLMAQNQAFMQMAGLLQQVLNKQVEFGTNQEQWQHWLSGQFDELQQALSQQQMKAMQPLSDMAKSWAGFWTQLLGIVTPLYIDTVQMAQEIDQSHLFDQLFPGLGYTRERQEKIKHGVQLWSQYQQANTDYNNAMFKIALEALDSFREKLFERASTGEKIKSLRELYDLWVDCYEAAFAAFVMTDEYSRLYGSLVNTGMAFRQHNQQMVDELLRSMNLPNREAMESLTRRQQQMRRELSEAKRRLERMDDMEAQLADLQAQVAKLGKPKTTTRKTTANKSDEGK